MSVFLDNPVLRRELTKHLRLRRSRIATKAMIAALVLIILRYYVLLLVRTENGATSDANDAFGYCLYSVLVATALLSPSLAAMSISREQETQTWEQLSLTRLTPHQVLFGKWLGRQAEVGLLTAVIAPMVMVSAFRSSIDLAGSMCVLVFLALNTAFFTMIGIVCSMAARRTITATGTALVVSAVLCVGPDVIRGLLDSWLPMDGTMLIRAFSPFAALDCIVYQLTGRDSEGWGGAYSSNVMSVLWGNVSFEVLTIVIGYAWLKRRYGRLQ